MTSSWSPISALNLREGPYVGKKERRPARGSPIRKQTARVFGVLDVMKRHEALGTLPLEVATGHHDLPLKGAEHRPVHGDANLLKDMQPDVLRDRRGGVQEDIAPHASCALRELHHPERALPKHRCLATGISPIALDDPLCLVEINQREPLFAHIALIRASSPPLIIRDTTSTCAFHRITIPDILY